MIYLAILLILCGLLILITALSVETGKSEITAKKRGAKSAGAVFDDFDEINPDDRVNRGENNVNEEDIFISFDDEPDDIRELKNTEPDDDWGIESTAKYDSERTADTPAGKGPVPGSGFKINRPDKLSFSDTETVSAVMFDDRSNVIDYESGTGVIDSTLAKYKSIKRIGKGRIEADFDGVSFYLDEKLYRFDFHKIYDIWSGPDYIALPLKGNSTVKLFMIENSPGFPGEVEEKFKIYEKGL